MLVFILQITSTDTDAVLATAGGVVGDWLPLIVIVIGIDIAFIIFENIMARRK